jgi:hypothetical protein
MSWILQQRWVWHWRPSGELPIFMEMGICQVLFRQLTQNLSYVQKTGCCVLGEGYGATLAGLIMASDTEGLVKCGALINPVTDWRHMGEFAAI